MARRLTPSEFYTELGRRISMPSDRTQEIWEIFIDYMLEELKIYNIMSLPLFATVENLKRGDKYKAMPKSPEELEIDNTELSKLVYIPEYRQLSVRPTDGFKEQLNDIKITRHEKNKQKQVINKQRIVEENLIIQKEREEKARIRFEKVMQKKLEIERKRKKDRQKSKAQLEREKHYIDYGNEDDEET